MHINIGSTEKSNITVSLFVPDKEQNILNYYCFKIEQIFFYLITKLKNALIKCSIINLFLK